MDLPEDMTELAALAHQHHEMYTAYVDAGFAPDQALRILISVITAGLGNSA
ncbi:hypothetical protein [Streptomyces cucumeris]|uniref:hypothetical protein n=1 Tax=Streptomyces cucumeris TaxID=2962890 RepID=UPI003D71A143